MDKLNVITDADLINEYGQRAMEAPAPVIETQAPSHSEVTLLAGAVINGVLATEAEVRELNGADEEAIAKAGSIGKALNVVLSRGVSSIGGAPVTESALESMLAGDRDNLLLAIRRVTFGNNIETDIDCPECLSPTHINIDLTKDVPVRPFNGQWRWDIETKLGTVTVGYYNGLTQKRLMDNLDKTAAELNSVVLAGCIQAVNGQPVIASEVAKAMGIADREKVLKSVLDTAPGPRLLEVTKACEACGKTLYLPLSLASLFRL